MTSWKDILSDYTSYLVIERALSKNSVSSYISDISKLAGTYNDKSPEELSGEDLSAFIARGPERIHSAAGRRHLQEKSVQTDKCPEKFLRIHGDRRPDTGQPG